MALTEEKEYQTTVLPDGQLQVREITIIKRDGLTISCTNHRKTIDVGDDVSAEPQMIKDIAATVHTPECLQAREAFKAEQDA